ncbi:hypothetical protein [Hymenobacter sp. IS2118]|uniref:hypothetical protein n=1 Tax=Hymenobacter sp. IS2118 TaxID=1505605 RepID=UPI00055945DB|nr:hypothetical protein [Hymenobacter sp. IS2118]
MISTQNYSALPDAAALETISKALAVLDAINSPDWEYRYYSYNANWGEGEEAMTMRNGSGDELLVLFRSEGCVISGLMHEYPQPDKARITRGLPACFEEFIFGEPVQSTGTTFCLWHTAPNGWQTGALQDEDDGSEELLSIFDGRPDTYVDWANEYYCEEASWSPLDAGAVAKIYRGESLTKAHVLALVNEVADWPQLEKDLQAIGYPYNFA